MPNDNLINIEFLRPLTPFSENKLLPARMKPLPDELFSSWLTRLAMAHYIKLHTFSRFIFGAKEIWNRDIDKSADSQHIAKMQEITGYNEKIISETLLSNYEGRLYEFHNPNGNSAWIMPVGVHRRTRKDFGLQMCPVCLKEDSEPYYRRAWRLSWVTVCTKHKIVLHDRCPGCQNPIIFHRGEMGIKSRAASDSMTECPNCKLDWSLQNVISTSGKANIDVLKFQKRLQRILESGWGEISNYGFVHSILYFKGLKQVLKLLSINKGSKKFREAISAKSKLPLPEDQLNRRSFDYLSITERYKAIRLANWLLFDWDERMVNAAIISKTWSSVLLSGTNDPPFWYWSTVYNFLTRNTCHPSQTEILSAFAYLKNRNQLILPSHLKRLFGKVDLLRKESEKFKTKLYEQMRENNNFLVCRQ